MRKLQYFYSALQPYDCPYDGKKETSPDFILSPIESLELPERFYTNLNLQDQENLYSARNFKAIEKVVDDFVFNQVFAIRTKFYEDQWAEERK